MEFEEELFLRKPGQVVQVAVNGADHVLWCLLDEDCTKLLKTESMLASDVIKAKSYSFIKQGQRVALLLDRVVQHQCFDSAATSRETSGVMELTFDNKKDIKIIPAEVGIDVLPKGILCR